MLISLQGWLEEETGFKIGWTTTNLSLRDIQTRGLLQRFARLFVNHHENKKNGDKSNCVCFTDNVSIAYHVFLLQRGFLGLCGQRVDAIDAYKAYIKSFDKKVSHVKTIPNIIYIQTFFADAYSASILFRNDLCPLIASF